MANEPEFKYLAIRNWTKFQTMTDKNGKNLDGRPRPYIRDYCDKETDSQYAALSVFGRYFFDACRRLRGKFGRNLPNDHMWILRQLDVSGTERGRATHAIQALVGRGLLIPTNQQFDIPQAVSPSLEVEVGLDLEKVQVQTSLDSIPSDTEVQTPTLKCGGCGATIVKGWKKRTCPRCRRPLGKSEQEQPSVGSSDTKEEVPPVHPKASAPVPETLEVLVKRLREIVTDKEWDVQESDIADMVLRTNERLIPALTWFLDQNDAQRLQQFFPKMGPKVQRRTIGNFPKFTASIGNLVKVYEAQATEPEVELPPDVELPKSKAFELED